ncbi:hypothetical protein EDD21DRAFT_371299 [Dissophora ornata]|nr:hypothetical protein BGZ58_001593 [Dissophora ornata]KAI8602652.1 hypothetical protein EDD21DRAFT_371299 [Dissophora ornata]
MAAINNITDISSEVQETIAPLPNIAFVEPDRRGRDHSVTPLEEDVVAQDFNSMSGSTSRTRRTSLGAFVERLRSRSRSHSRQRPSEGDLPMDRTNTQSSIGSTSSRKSSKSRSGSRSRSEDNGPYADVVRAQNEFMEKLRDEQEKNHITHNADGIPIPPRSRPSSRSGSRRSSISHALGLDKPLLAL